jgi:hypothetical protein
MLTHQTSPAGRARRNATALVALAAGCGLLLSACATPRDGQDDVPGATAPQTQTPTPTPEFGSGDELHDATFSLDPENPPSAEDTVLHLLVMEQACHGGEDAEGRVEVVTMNQTDTSIELDIGVRPDTSSDAWTCQTNPATPFTVELDQPLGERDILDIGVSPVQPVEESAPAFSPPAS